MALILRFSFAAQVIAAFVIFVVGYIGLFVTLMLGLVIATCLYEGVKWLAAAYSSRSLLQRRRHNAGLTQPASAAAAPVAPR